LGQSAALYCRVSTADQTCVRQERDLRAFAKKAGYKVVGVWKETASGTKDVRAERKKVLALAQARKVDVILVTELTRWGRSMLDLFHTLQDLQAWDVSLLAQTGLQSDLRSAQGKLIARSWRPWRSSNGIYCVSECARASRLRASAASCSVDDPVSASRRTI
jgi:putative DNA-invertase from lambdoid prophage Rac